MMELIAVHRRALANALATLSPDQWRGESLCAGWTPAHVLAHLTMPFRISAEDFMAGLRGAGGDFTAYSDEIAARDSTLPAADLVAVLRDNADTPWSPPGGGLVGALSHDVIHGLDMTWPLGLSYEIPDRAMTLVLDSVVTPVSETLFGIPLQGIGVVATDLSWSAGDGARLAGHSRDLLPLLAGRPVPRERFDGDGVRDAWPAIAR
jgi:uncharacterized protein (TIGR03083 family)